MDGPLPGCSVNSTGLASQEKSSFLGDDHLCGTESRQMDNVIVIHSAIIMNIHPSQGRIFSTLGDHKNTTCLLFTQGTSSRAVSFESSQKRTHYPYGIVDSMALRHDT